MFFVFELDVFRVAEGFQHGIEKSEGTAIVWAEGKNVTVSPANP